MKRLLAKVLHHHAKKGFLSEDHVNFVQRLCLLSYPEKKKSAKKGANLFLLVQSLHADFVMFCGVFGIAA